jgi:hypothetical protein
MSPENSTTVQQHPCAWNSIPILCLLVIFVAQCRNEGDGDYVYSKEGYGYGEHGYGKNKVGLSSFRQVRPPAMAWC